MTEKKNPKTNIAELMPADEDDRRRTTIDLPQAIWDALDNDADRCKRKRSQQLEALLEAFYFGVTADIPTDRLQEMAKVSSQPIPASPRHDRYDATAYVEPEKKRGKK